MEDASTGILIPVLANDVDFDVPYGDIITLSGFTQGANGTVSQSGTNLIYTLTASNYCGADTFTYSIQDSL